MSIIRTLIFALVALGPKLFADDWPQWRGPRRDGISTEADWFAGWPENGAPAVAWRAHVGKGHSAISVRGEFAYTMGWNGNDDIVFCLKVETGAIVWKQAYPCSAIVQWSGPRATPTIDGDTVFTLGQHGQLRAWDVATGAARWAVDLPQNYQPDADYGFAWSPLIEGDLLILGTGSHGLALRKSDGRFAWGNDGKAGACVSPMPFTFDGRRGVAMVAMDSSRDHVNVVGVDAASGRELWRFGPWKEKWGAACSDLLIHDQRVFLSTAEQQKLCAVFEFASGTTREIWSNRKLSTYTGNVVLVGGHLFGVDKTGILKCLDWLTGEERWAHRGFEEFGTLIAADGKLIVQSGKSGALTVVEAAAEAFRELRTMKVFKDARETFTAPVLANDRIFCRSYAGEVVCLTLASPH